MPTNPGDIWQGTAVNQQPSGGTDYPFVAPPDAIRYLIGDLWLLYPDDDNSYVLPLRVTRLIGFDGAIGTKDVIIKDAAGVEVFNTISVATRTSTAWGDNLLTLSWSSGEKVLRCTMRKAPPPWDPARTWAADITTDAVLDARAYMRLPQRVRSIKVGLTTISAGDLLLEEGFNTRMQVEAFAGTDGVRRVNRILVRMKPGDGLGRRPGCDDEGDPELKHINGIGPSKSGDLVLQGSDCYRIQRPVSVTQVSPRQVAIGHEGLTEEEALASLQMFSACVPCCECNDYVRTYRGIVRLDDRYRTMSLRAESLRDVLLANAQRWEAQRACRVFQSLRLVVSPEDRCTVFVGGLHCNMTESCVLDLTLRLTVETFTDGSPVTPDDVIVKCHEPHRAGADTLYHEVPFIPSGGYPVYDAHFDASDPQGSSRLRTRLRFPGCSASQTMRITLSVHAPNTPGVLLPDPGDVDVPAEVATLWATYPPPSPVRAVLTRAVAMRPSSGCDCP